MILREVLLALGFAAGFGFLIWRVVKTEDSIINHEMDELIELKSYPTGHDSIMIDEMLLRGANIPFVERSYGGRGTRHVVISVPPALLDEARTALGKPTAA